MSFLSFVIVIAIIFTLLMICSIILFYVMNKYFKEERCVSCKQELEKHNGRG